MDNLLEELQEVFREAFDDDELELEREQTADDIDGWDSMAHINLIIAVESTLGVKFATAEISGLKEDGSNVGGFVDLLASKIEAKG